MPKLNINNWYKRTILQREKYNKNSESSYNTLTNEYGDRIMIHGMTCTAIRKENLEIGYFDSERTAKIWLNKFKKAKKWVKSTE